MALFSGFLPVLLISSVVQLWMMAAAEENSALLVVHSELNETVVLNCTAEEMAGVEYRALRWYKEGVAPRLTGLLTKDLPDGRMRWFVGASTQISLVQHTLNLQLPNVSCSHRGVYQCYLAAPVGQQNREGRVRLAVSGCPRDEETPEDAETDVKDSCLLLGAVVVMFAALLIFLLSYRSLRNLLWLQTKPGMETGKEKNLDLDPDPNSLPEKVDLMRIYTLGPRPKNSSPLFRV